VATQAVQAAHAAVEHAARHPHTAGGYLILLTADSEAELERLASFIELRTEVTRFYEPDLGNALTAIAASGPVTRRKLAHLPLLLRGEVMNGGRKHVVAAG
jgi:hypothetical protein